MDGLWNYYKILCIKINYYYKYLGIQDKTILLGQYSIKHWFYSLAIDL